MDPIIAVFGAGIAGLTAAHELAARGFSVDVYDPSPALGRAPFVGEGHDPLYYGYGAGGVARTQYHKSQKALLLAHGYPGEHGFRFFPSFYRHLTDTMRRIPVERPGVEPRNRPFVSVADNLVPTITQGISTSAGDKLYTYDRRLPSSLDAVLQALLASLRGFDYRMIDLNRFMLKIFQFMTSCNERRSREYERMSWWEFLGGDRYEARFRQHMNAVTRALVAMDAERSDARTQGQILAQLFMDHFSDGRSTDRLLNGPTSDQWLVHWYRFLETGAEEPKEFPAMSRETERGDMTNFIQYHQKRLERFEVIDGRITAAILRDSDDNIERETYEYYVLAIDVEALRAGRGAGALITPEMADADARENPDDPALKKLLQLANLPEEDRSAWMSGLQIYLSEDIKILPGHVYFPDSEWGLSAVSQVQFWGPDTRRRYGRGLVRGIISVIISRWDTAGALVKKPAKRCTKKELGIEVWHQLRLGLMPSGIRLAAGDDEEPGRPYLDHHVDVFLVDYKGKPVCDCATLKDGTSLGDDRPVHANLAPVFICRPGTWALRPGPLDGGYRVRLGGLVLAGAYTQTHTGLPTMEAANESGRHAVNAILAHEEKKLPEGSAAGLTAVRFEKCRIFPLDQHEFGDLRWLKRVDEMLFDMGSPHMIEILDVEKLLDTFMPRGTDGSGFARAIYEQVNGLAEGISPLRRPQ